MQDSSHPGCASGELWPIYELANYNNSGCLLERCRSLLDANQRRELRNTNNENQVARSTAIKQSRFDQPTDSAGQATGIAWWQLAGSGNQGEPTGADFDLARKLAKLTLFVYERVAPFVSIHANFDRLDASQRNAESIVCGPSQTNYIDHQQQQKLATDKVDLGARKWPQRHACKESVEPTATGHDDRDQNNKLSWFLELAIIQQADFQPDSRHQSGERSKLCNLIKLIAINNNANNNGETHEWSRRCSKRGQYGESLSHILLVGNTNEHLILLVILLNLWPRMVGDTFASKKFFGLGALHLSVAYQRVQHSQEHQQREKQATHQPRDVRLKGDERSARNCLLLGHLLRVARRNNLAERIRDQRVTGTLFKSPHSEQKLISSRDARSPEATESRDGNKGFFANHSKVSDALESPTSDLNQRSPFWCDRQLNWPAVRGHAHLLFFNPTSRMTAREASGGDDASGASNDEAPTTTYLGDSPLAWSVTLQSRACFERLLSEGADLNSQDCEGNTILHLIILNKQLNWARLLVKCGSRPEIRNSRGFTPFLMAARFGQLALFNELLDLSAVEFWAYSMIRCCGYPLTSLDSINPAILDPNSRARARARAHHSGVLVLLESPETSDQQKAQLLGSPVVERLLQEKWQLYARRLFYRELFLSLVHLALFTLANSLRPSRNSRGSNSDSEEHALDYLGQRNLVRVTSELCTFALSIRQVGRFLSEWRRYGNVKLQWAYNPLQANVLMANSFVIVCGLIRMLALSRLVLVASEASQLPRSPATRASVPSAELDATVSENLLDSSLESALETCEEILLVFAAPLLWSGLFFFIAAYKVTGPFVAMFRYMIVRDLRQFSLIYLIFMCSFAQCIFYVNRDPGSQISEGDEQESLWLNYVRLWLDLFRMTFGVYEFQPFRHSVLGRLALLTFLYAIPILFNMLIAMMNNTYSMVINQSERAWSFQWARTLIALERSLPLDELAAYQREYSINMGAKQASEGDAPTDDATKSNFVPGLMIIKRMESTKAEQKRIVLGYWKKSIKAILSNIKEQQQQQQVADNRRAL